VFAPVRTGGPTTASSCREARSALLYFIDHLCSVYQSSLSSYKSHVIERKRRLIGLNLIIDIASTDPNDDALRKLGNLDWETRGSDRRPYWTFITELGREFLAFIHDPLDATQPAASDAVARR